MDMKVMPTKGPRWYPPVVFGLVVNIFYYYDSMIIKNSTCCQCILFMNMISVGCISTMLFNDQFRLYWLHACCYRPDSSCCIVLARDRWVFQLVCMFSLVIMIRPCWLLFNMTMWVMEMLWFHVEFPVHDKSSIFHLGNIFLSYFWLGSLVLIDVCFAYILVL